VVTGDQTLEASFQSANFVFVPHWQRRWEVSLRSDGNEFFQTVETTLQPEAKEKRAHWRAETKEEQAVREEGRARRGRKREEEQKTAERTNGEEREQNDRKTDAIPPTHRDCIYTQPPAR
jgi:hypothetical protein